MKTDHSTNSNEPDRPEMETAGSTSSKSKINDDCPILTLPDDILAKVIAYVPVAQWPALELLYDFRPAVLIAWRQLRNINVNREFLIKTVAWDDRSFFCKVIESTLQKFVERSPFSTSISGIELQLYDTGLNSYAIQSLAQFEHLQSISLGDTIEFTGHRRGIALESAVEFLESTRSRTSLKELQLFISAESQYNRATILDRFASSFVNGRKIHSPIKLEKLVLMSSHISPNVRLDTMDTTRLTDIRLGKSAIEPHQLTSLIERASNLIRIEFSFLHCYRDCNGQRLQANKELLTALASHECWMAIKFCGEFAYNDDSKCSDFGFEFIQMLRTIGRRGQLKKLAVDRFYTRSSGFGMDDICAAIRDYIPHLQSIKLHGDMVLDESVADIVNSGELEEIQLTQCWLIPQTEENAMKKIAQHPRLKRLAGDLLPNVPPESLKCLADVKSLTELRIRIVHVISSDVFEKWSDGFAPNLRVLMLLMFGKEDISFEEGLVRLLETAVRLRVVILVGRCATEQALEAIAKSCPELEILAVGSMKEDVAVERLQEIVDRCPKLHRLGGVSDNVLSKLQIPKYRKIGKVDWQFWNYDFDDDEYD